QPRFKLVEKILIDLALEPRAEIEQLGGLGKSFAQAFKDIFKSHSFPSYEFSRESFDSCGEATCVGKSAVSASALASGCAVCKRSRIPLTNLLDCAVE